MSYPHFILVEILFSLLTLISKHYDVTIPNVFYFHFALDSFSVRFYGSVFSFTANTLTDVAIYADFYRLCYISYFFFINLINSSLICIIFELLQFRRVKSNLFHSVGDNRAEKILTKICFRAIATTFFVCLCPVLHIYNPD